MILVDKDAKGILSNGMRLQNICVSLFFIKQVFLNVHLFGNGESFLYHKKFTAKKFTIQNFLLPHQIPSYI
jgi:hypothetical protein